MDVKPSTLYPPVPVREAYRRPAALLPRSPQPAAVISSEDVIDCVEVQSDGYQTPTGLETLYGKHIDKHLIVKGKLIDLWI
jgi:hypothetical protein